MNNNKRRIEEKIRYDRNINKLKMDYIIKKNDLKNSFKDCEKDLRKILDDIHCRRVTVHNNKIIIYTNLIISCGKYPLGHYKINYNFIDGKLWANISREEGVLTWERPETDFDDSRIDEVEHPCIMNGNICYGNSDSIPRLIKSFKFSRAKLRSSY